MTLSEGGLTDGSAAAFDPLDLFRATEVEHYDFSGAPRLVRLRATAYGKLWGEEAAEKWQEKQSQLVRWARDPLVLMSETVEPIKQEFDAFFRERGPLAGTVLDIGGGWGLYREYWEGKGGYVVHDPGVEMIEAGPAPSHARLYSRGSALPAAFVEGVGEHLPYVDGAFDTCLNVSCLDHCVNPLKVIGEARRCLKAGGQFLVIQDCHEPGETAPAGPSLALRLWRAVRRPRYLLSAVYQRLVWSRQPDPHLHTFTRAALEDLYRSAGFVDVRVGRVACLAGLFAFEGRRP